MLNNKEKLITFEKSILLNYMQIGAHRFDDI